MKFIHLTDLHVTPDTARLFGQDVNANLRRAVEDIARHHSDALFCAITGDLTHDGDAEAYGVLKEILAPLKMPVHMTIGNHDVRAEAQRCLDLPVDAYGFTQIAIPSPIGTLLMLDSKDEATHGGAYCDARQAWLRDALAEHRDVPVWIFIHHPPFPLSMPAMDQIRLRDDDSRALAEVLGTHPNVRHIFFGHYHRPVSGVWQGIPFSSHRSMMLQCGLEMAGGEEIAGIFEEPQYAVVLAEPGLTRVHLHDFGCAADQVSMGAPES